jgi:hypothetical protein
MPVPLPQASCAGGHHLRYSSDGPEERNGEALRIRFSVDKCHSVAYINEEMLDFRSRKDLRSGPADTAPLDWEEADSEPNCRNSRRSASEVLVSRRNCRNPGVQENELLGQRDRQKDRKEGQEKVNGTRGC